MSARKKASQDKQESQSKRKEEDSMRKMFVQKRNEALLTQRRDQVKVQREKRHRNEQIKIRTNFVKDSDKNSRYNTLVASLMNRSREDINQSKEKIGSLLETLTNIGSSSEHKQMPVGAVEDMKAKVEKFNELNEELIYDINNIAAHIN